MESVNHVVNFVGRVVGHVDTGRESFAARNGFDDQHPHMGPVLKTFQRLNHVGHHSDVDDV